MNLKVVEINGKSYLGELNETENGAELKNAIEIGGSVSKGTVSNYVKSKQFEETLLNMTFKEKVYVVRELNESENLLVETAEKYMALAVKRGMKRVVNDEFDRLFQ